MYFTAFFSLQDAYIKENYSLRDKQLKHPKYAYDHMELETSALKYFCLGNERSDILQNSDFNVQSKDLSTGSGGKS